MPTPYLFDSQWIYAFILNSILITISRKSPLLTRSGWIHAGALGTILWGCLGWKGWISVVIYLIFGSFVTRLGLAYKQRAGIAEKRGGSRGPENVWGSAATGAVLALILRSGIGSPDLLVVGFAASFSAKLADTFGSEIGKRWGTNAYLITSLRPVAVGTDGAISIEGTLASFIGSLLMSIFMLSISLLNSFNEFVLVALVGLIATLFESYLGAIVQNKYKILTNEVVNFIQTAFSACLAMFIYIGFTF